MQHWEYRVVVLRDRQYTEALNEFGREGWELVTVTSEPLAPPSAKGGPSIPKPRALGAIEAAADKVTSLGGSGQADEPPATSRLLWVFRRPLGDD